MYSMVDFKVAEARARFGEVLDAAEQGRPVVIERRGVRFRVVAEPGAGPRPAAALLEFVDPAVMSGRWTWKADSRGNLRFAARRRKAR